MTRASRAWCCNVRPATLDLPLRIFRRVLVLLLVLAGIGVAIPASAEGRICTDNDVITFGNRLLGTYTSGNIVVTNCGNQPWSFTDVSVHPATGPAFQVSTTCATGLALTPGGNCTVSVVFAPVITGQTSGGLWLRNTTTFPDELVTFYGRGIDAQAGTASLTFIPAGAAFGMQALDVQSDALMVEVHNDGPAALTPTRFVLNGPAAYDFISVFDTCKVGTAIPAGQGCSLALYFTPKSIGARLANLVIDSPQLTSLAILPISGIGATPTPPTADVIEFYNAALDHYFISWVPNEIATLDAGAQIKGWSRTGFSFKTFPVAQAGTSPVCRYYIPPGLGDSHFFGRGTVECNATGQKNPDFVLEDAAFMQMFLPTAGVCPPGTTEVYRVFSNRPDANHRYMTSRSVRDQMVAKGWLAEGDGPDLVVMCAPK